MKAPGRDLTPDQQGQHGHEDAGPGQIAQLHRHGDGVTRRLTQGGGQDLDDPEAEGDGGNLAQDVTLLFGHDRSF